MWMLSSQRKPIPPPIHTPSPTGFLELMSNACGSSGALKSAIAFVGDRWGRS